MAKIFDNRPDDWDDKDEDGVKKQSSVSEYKSGKIQKNIVSDDSIVQEELAEGKKKKLVSSENVEETSQGNIYTTHEDDTKITQQAQTAKESYHAKDFSSTTKQETTTIQAKSKVESISADTTTISDNKLTETGSGKHTITATKSINLKSNKATISTEKLNVKSAGFNVTAKEHIEKAPFKNIKAGSVKYNIGSKMVIDGALTKSAFRQQNAWTKDQSYKHPDDNKEDVFYLGEIVYSPAKKRLYFIQAEKARDIFDSQQQYLKQSSHGSHYKHNFGKRDITNRFGDFEDLEKLILDNQEYIHLCFYRARMCMLDQAILDSLNAPYIDFDRDKHLKEDNGLLNWQTIIADVNPKLQQQGFKAINLPEKEDKFNAIDDAVSHLQNISDEDVNRWLDIGATRQGSLLYMGLLQGGKFNFKQLIDRNARLPLKPDVVATVDFDNDSAAVRKHYHYSDDSDYGIFEVVTMENYIDSQILLSKTAKVTVKDGKYTLEGKNHAKYPKGKDNEIVDAILFWYRVASMKHSAKLERFNLGRLLIEDIEAKQLTKPYQIDCKDDEWLIYADSQYVFKSHNKNADYPTGDALVFEATTDDFALERFYYYQEARAQFELDAEIVSKEIKQMLVRRANYQMLVDTYDIPKDEDIKKYLESLQENGKTKDIESVLAELEKAPDELILALVPESVGKLLYLLNNPSKASQKAIENSIELSERVLKMCIKLLSTFRTRKGYLIALKHYQPLNEYDEVDPVKSVEHLWDREEDMLVIESKSLGKKINGLYNDINSEKMTLKLRKDKELFAKHEYLDIKQVPIMLTRDSVDIIHDLKEEDQEDTSQPLTDLPDKDASVLCELVYEKSALDFAFRDERLRKLNLANICYKTNGVVRDDEGFSLSKDFKYALENYPNYYRSILRKYKLITTSSKYVADTQSSFVGTAPSYFAMVVAHAKDKDNKGVYVVNRGTIEGWDFWSDLRMGAGKLIPSPNFVPQLETGIRFTESFLKENPQVENLNFSGHSLGGSIAQIQAIYFYDNGMMYGGQTRCFEPFGTISEVDSSFGFNIGNTYFYPNLNLLSDIQHAINWVSFGSLFAEWQGLAEKLVGKYQDNADGIKLRIINFARQGDPVAEMSGQVGQTRKLATGTKSCYNYMPQNMKGIVAVPEVIKNSFLDRGNMYQDHRIVWYRYNQYNEDGTLIQGATNSANKSILQSGQSEEAQGLKAYFKEVFNEDI